MTGYPIYPAIIEAMFGWLGEFYVHLGRAPGAESLTIDEHARSLRVIRAGNHEEAGHAMHDHISRVNNTAVGLIRAAGPVSPDRFIALLK